MFCEKCGANIGPGEMFCANCGARVAPVPTRNIYPNNQPVRRPSTGYRGGARAGALETGMKGYIIAGLGVLMLIWSLLPFIKISAFGISVSYSLFQFNSLAHELGESLWWLIAFVLVTIALAVAAGFMKNKVMYFVSAGVSLLNLLFWIIVMSKISSEMMSDLGMHINIFGAGLYLFLITLAIEAGLAIYTGIKSK